MMIYSNYTYSGTSYVRDPRGPDDLNGLLIPSELASICTAMVGLERLLTEPTDTVDFVTFICSGIHIHYALEVATKPMATTRAIPSYCEARLFVSRYAFARYSVSNAQELIGVSTIKAS